MKFFDKWFKKAKAPSSPDVRGLVYTSEKPPGKEAKAFLRSFGLRPGMWVDNEGRVGIVLGTNLELVELAIVDNSGNTKEKVLVIPNFVRKAKLEEIPEFRRRTMDEASLEDYK